MPREKRSGNKDRRTKLNREAGDIAAVLAKQMRAFGKAAEVSARYWQICIGRQEYGRAEEYLETSLKLADAMAKLAGAIARIKGESHQHIKVERLAASRTNAPATAPSNGSNALDQQDNSVSSAPEQGGGGNA